MLPLAHVQKTRRLTGQKAFVTIGLPGERWIVYSEFCFLRIALHFV
jgi:hypothetical protein